MSTKNLLTQDGKLSKNRQVEEKNIFNANPTLVNKIVCDLESF
ncbi:Transposase [Caenorhabditis elegans]|uniref:Transposase n=1 Tax=Caenorhabditis elegans TaxID=6239 RepID=A0A4V0ILT9_CAEEL|nr:Transposase [Caenorhabditis elegans]VTW47505.1 Transposase [Caenorhabditis elegans]